MEEKLKALLQQLLNAESSELIFKEMAILLSSLSSSVLSETITSMNMDLRAVVSAMLSHITTRTSSDDGVCCLQKFIQSLHPTVLIDLESILISGINHSSSDVQEIFLKELKKCVQNDKALASFLQNAALLSSIAKLIADDNSSVSKHSAELLALLCSQNKLGPYFLASLRNAFHQLMNGTDTVKFRLFQMIVNISSSSPTALQSVADDYLEKLIHETRQQHDILVQLNGIELLTEIALRPHGLMYLQEKGIPRYFEQSMQDAMSNPLASLLLPGYLHFFGNIGIENPNAVASVIPVLFSIVNDYNGSIQGIAVETVGAIAILDEGKLLLNSFQDSMEKCMHTIGQIIMSGELEQRVRAINSVVQLLTTVQENEMSDIVYLTEKWYKCLTDHPTSMFVAISKQPFQSMKLGAFDVLARLASTDWGQKEIVSQPGFLEFLLDRSTQNTKEGKERVYAIAQEIVESPNADKIFNKDILLQLQKYVQQGPFFVEVQSAVEFEGSH